MAGVWTVEGPRTRDLVSNFSSWSRAVDGDGSTIAYVPTMVRAAQIADLQEAIIRATPWLNKKKEA